MMDIVKEHYGIIGDNEIHQYTLINSVGTQLKVINYGGIVTNLFVSDKNGNTDDIVCGFDQLSGYLGQHPYFGAIIGRYGNRIAKGRFTLDGIDYELPKNLGVNTLHGGIKDFSKHVWKAKIIEDKDQVGVVLSRVSAHMEEGFPGNLDVAVTYLLSNENEWKIEYRATTDRPTIINLTNHSYFNLAGHEKGDILDHLLFINADLYTVLDKDSIPTGEIRSVTGTPFDFRTNTRIGDRISDNSDSMIKDSRGYDLNFVLAPGPGELVKFAKVQHEESGRYMEVSTTEPGVQLYCSNWVEEINGKSDVIYNPYCAVCLETQHFPDSPNHNHFPSTILRPGDEYSSTTVYAFGVIK